MANAFEALPVAGPTGSDGRVDDSALVGEATVSGGHPAPAPVADRATRQDETVAVIPVVAESLRVDKQVSETGRGVRVTKKVSEHEQVVDEPLAQDELRVERIPLNRFVEASQPPAIRQEGDVTVVPVLEEVLVTEKRLLLKEEVRITRVRREVHKPQRMVLRSEQVSVERFDDSNDPAGSERRDD